MIASTDPTLAAEVLREARDRSGRSIERWLAAELASVGGPVLELRCATADPARVVTLRRAGSSEAVYGRTDALPVDSGVLAGVCAILCLPALEPLDGLFAELRRVLRPTGTLAALVPSRPSSLSFSERRGWRPLHRALGGRPRFRHESARDRLGWLFASADFAVLADVRRTFWIPVPDPGRAMTVVTALAPSGIWPLDLPAERTRLAAEALARAARPGYRLPIPLRLVTGRR